MARKKFDLKLKGYVGGYNFNADLVDFKLDQVKDTTVNVMIDSLGGSVKEALSICHAFKNHAKVDVHFVGLNASAATIASLGANRITAEPSAMYLVHKCSSLVFEWASMNADQLATKIAELEAQKKDLEKFDLNIAEMYCKKCKKLKEDLLALMKEGAWLSAKEALEWGFIDEITAVESTSSEPVLTASAAQALEANGYPLPNIELSQDNSFVSQIVSSISKLFKSQTENLNFMTKKFALLGALLGISAFESKENKFTFTAEQMQQIEDDLQAKDKKIKDLSDDVSAKESVIEALKKKPADKTTNIVTSEEEDEDVPDFFKTVTAAKELQNFIRN